MRAKRSGLWPSNFWACLARFSLNGRFFSTETLSRDGAMFQDITSFRERGYRRPRRCEAALLARGVGTAPLGPE